MASEKIKNGYSDDVRLALLEQSINNINNTLIRFEKRFDQIDSRFDHVESKLFSIESKFDYKLTSIDSKFESRFDKMESNNRSYFRWTMGLISGIYLIYGSALITVIVKFIH